MGIQIRVSKTLFKIHLYYLDLGNAELPVIIANTEQLDLTNNYAH